MSKPSEYHLRESVTRCAADAKTGGVPCVLVSVELSNEAFGAQITPNKKKRHTKREEMKINTTTTEYCVAHGLDSNKKPSKPLFPYLTNRWARQYPTACASPYNSDSIQLLFYHSIALSALMFISVTLIFWFCICFPLTNVDVSFRISNFGKWLNEKLNMQNSI